MNSRLLSAVTGLAGAWTTLYTAGMPPTVRQTRRNEIASDLWECCAEVARGERCMRRAAIEILTRLFLGIPDDIFWRWENQMNTTATQGQVPLWLNAAGLGIPLSALGMYFATMFSKSLNDTSLAVALRESAYIFPTIITVHVIAMCAFIGFAAMVDLRMLGVTLKRTPALEVGQSMLPLAMGGFALVLLSGALVYISDPMRYASNSFFDLKVLMLFLGGLNAWASYRRVFRHSNAWQESGLIPARDKTAAALSLIVWAVIITSSRLIAFAS